MESASFWYFPISPPCY